ncbi:MULTISPECIES: nitronate monooxygenase [unclassified Mycobacteroides]|uniref:nitronate monooxygenase n=1 Tax=unclassified Mycobacteroides TaxID=2618759 RepID=UPI0035C822EB
MAAGYLTADALADRITAARALTTGALGVNLFVPQPSMRTGSPVRPNGTAWMWSASLQ